MIADLLLEVFEPNVSHKSKLKIKKKIECTRMGFIDLLIDSFHIVRLCYVLFQIRMLSMKKSR